MQVVIELIYFYYQCIVYGNSSDTNFEAEHHLFLTGGSEEGAYFPSIPVLTSWKLENIYTFQGCDLMCFANWLLSLTGN